QRQARAGRGPGWRGRGRPARRWHRTGAATAPTATGAAGRGGRSRGGWPATAWVGDPGAARKTAGQPGLVAPGARRSRRPVARTLPAGTAATPAGRRMMRRSLFTIFLV